MCVCVCAAEEDYLRDGLYKTDAIVSSLDLNQAVTEIIPVVFPLAKKGCLLFLVKLINTQQLIIAPYSGQYGRYSGSINKHETCSISVKM